VRPSNCALKDFRKAANQSRNPTPNLLYAKSDREDMNTSLSLIRPARGDEYASLIEKAKDAINMTPNERLQLGEKMRQAYYGYTPETAPKVARIFTLVNTKTNEIVSKRFF